MDPAYLFSIFSFLTRSALATFAAPLLSSSLHPSLASSFPLLFHSLFSFLPLFVISADHSKPHFSFYARFAIFQYWRLN
jgi:hypothetical protein